MALSIYRLSFNLFHKYLPSDIVNFLQVGTNYSLDTFDVKYKDNTFDNISDLYPYYGNLTGLYWVYKNDQASTHIGIFQNNTLINFSAEKLATNNNNQVVFADEKNLFTPKDYYSKLCSDTQIKHKLAESSCVLAEQSLIDNLLNCTTYHDLILKKGLLAKDLLILENCLPDNLKATYQQVLANKTFYVTCFVMPRELFMQYAEFLFTILNKIESQLTIINYINRGIKVFQHLGDILYNIFIAEYILKSQRKVYFGQLIAFHKTARNLVFSAKDNSIAHIFTAFNKAYLVPASAFINSITTNSHPTHKYKIICFVDKDVGRDDKLKLMSILEHRNNIELIFIPTLSLYPANSLSVRDYYSDLTYARLFIPSIFPDLNKCIYLDVDTVINTDIYDLYTIDIKDNYIAAVRDFGVIVDTNIYNPKSPVERLRYNRQKYMQEELNISDIKNYFQASVLVLNLLKIRQDNKVDEFLIELYKKYYIYQDQDILNKILHDKVYYLDYSWGVSCGDVRDKYTYYSNLDFTTFKDYLAAFNNVKIAHYLGEIKPWNSNCAILKSDLFFKYLKDTPYFEVYINNLYNIKYVAENKAKLNSKNTKKLVDKNPSTKQQ